MKIFTNLAGITFRDEIKALLVGDIVSLKHESDNKYDSNAVAVTRNGEHLGYIPKMKPEFSVDVQALWHKEKQKKGIVSSIGWSADGGKTWNNEGMGKIQSITISIESNENIGEGNFKNYEKDGKQYKRISSVLKKYPQDIDFLFKWGIEKFESYDEYREYLNQSAEEGTAMHKDIEDYLKLKKEAGDKMSGIGEEEYKLLTAKADMLFVALPENIQNFFNKLGDFKILGLEETLYDENLGIAGTYDAFLKIKGTNILLDWKSATKPQAKHKAQIGFYGKNKGVDVAWVVCFGATNKQGYTVSKVEIDREYKKVELIVKYF